MATFSFEHPQYNPRWLEPPWIAQADFTDRLHPIYVFGRRFGAKGGPCELIIEVEPGDVLVVSQKDIRRFRKDPMIIGVVQPNGSVNWGYTPAKARNDGQRIKAEWKGEVSTDPLDSFTSEELIQALINRGDYKPTGD